MLCGSINIYVRRSLGFESHKPLCTCATWLISEGKNFIELQNLKLSFSQGMSHRFLWHSGSRGPAHIFYQYAGTDSRRTLQPTDLHNDYFFA